MSPTPTPTWFPLIRWHLCLACLSLKLPPRRPLSLKLPPHRPPSLKLRARSSPRLPRLPSRSFHVRLTSYGRSQCLQRLLTSSIACRSTLTSRAVTSTRRLKISPTGSKCRSSSRSSGCWISLWPTFTGKKVSSSVPLIYITLARGSSRWGFLSTLSLQIQYESVSASTSRRQLRKLLSIFAPTHLVSPLHLPAFLRPRFILMAPLSVPIRSSISLYLGPLYSLTL